MNRNLMISHSSLFDLSKKKSQIKKEKLTKQVKKSIKQLKQKKKIMEDLEVKIEKISDDVIDPIRKTDGSVGYDICAYLPKAPIRIGPYSTTAIPTGIKLEIPKGYGCYILPRSGLSLKTPLRISNAPGLIDNDYRGEIQVLIDNIGAGYATINNGDRIAQMVFIKTERVRFQESKLSDTHRGENGFGSTGVNESTTSNK